MIQRIIINPLNLFASSTTLHKLKLQVIHYQIDNATLNGYYSKKDFFIWLS